MIRRVELPGASSVNARKQLNANDNFAPLALAAQAVIVQEFFWEFFSLQQDKKLSLILHRRNEA